MMKILRQISFSLLGLLCLSACSPSHKNLRIIGDLKWGDTIEDWEKRVPLCPTHTYSLFKAMGLRSQDDPYVGRELDNDPTFNIDSCKYNIGGVNFLVDRITFFEEKESKLSYINRIQLIIPNELEYIQILNVFNKKYPSCEGGTSTDFCSKYSKFNISKDAISDYEKSISSGEIGTMTIRRTDYSNEKILESITKIKEEIKKKQIGPLPKIDSNSF